RRRTAHRRQHRAPVSERIRERARARADADLEHVPALSRPTGHPEDRPRPRHADGLVADRLPARVLGHVARDHGGALESWHRPAGGDMSARVTHYEDRIVTAFTACAIVWSMLGMLAGVYAAAELVW